MFIIIWIITSIIVFSIIILIHEYGHFKTARIFWVKVEEFWLWIPPKAKELFTDKKWTKYTLNWLPLWGFVRLKWENINTFDVYQKNKKLFNNENLEKAIKSDEEIFDSKWEKLTKKEKEEILKLLQENYSKDSLMNIAAWKQAIIILAWIFMNFLLASIIFSILFFVWVSPIWINTKIQTNLDLKLIPTQETAMKLWLWIEKPWVYLVPNKDSIAQKSWIKDYDLVLNANNQEIKTSEELKNLIETNSWKVVNLEIKRSLNDCDITKNDNCEFENINIQITPSNEWKIWSYLVPNIEFNKDFKYKYWIIDSIKYWFLETWNQIILTFKWLKMLLWQIFFPETPTERQEAIAQVSWPIWMVDFMTKSILNWITFILIIWAIISINLWVFNLLPIPALDWWRFIFIIINSFIQKIFWKKAINEVLESRIHVIFFIILIILSVLIAYNDVTKIINN